MQQRTVLGVLVLWVLSSWLQLSWAQTEEAKLAEPTPAADWAVWRTFHGSLDFYDGDFPDDVKKLLNERAGLTSSESDELLAAGKDYLARLSTIDAEARQELEVRYPPSIFDYRFVPSVPSERPPPVAIHPPPASLLPKGESYAAGRYQKLVSDGFVARVDEERKAALDAHLTRLGGSLGEQKLAALKNWIRTDVAPKVKTGVIGRPAQP